MAARRPTVCRATRAPESRVWRRRPPAGFDDDTVNVDRPGDILQSLLARVLNLERHLIARVIEDCLRDADTAGFGNALKPCRDVDAVPKDVMRLDDYVADVDAHTERNAPVFRIIHCKFMDTILELHRSSNRLDRARKLRQEPVAGILHDLAAVFCDYRLDNVC